MKLTFVAVIPNYWGKADTQEKALQIAHKESGSWRKTKRVIYVTNDPDCYCDDIDGGLCYHATPGIWVVKITPDDKQVQVWPLPE